TCIAAIISMLLGAANILGLMTSYLPSFISMKITRYLALQDLNAFSEIPSEVRRAIGYAKRILFVVVFAWATYGMRNDDEGRTIRGMFNLFAFSSIMFMLLDSVHPVFSRLAMYYSASEIFLVSSVLYRFRKNAGIFIIYSVIVLYLISRLIYGFNNHPDLFYPYETIFQHSWKEVY
ncbi:EpsG family protein, partial [Escherichia coli]|nr:EpsG family protein [Escherichia coli]